MLHPIIPPGTITTCLSQNVTITGEIINDINTLQERNIEVLGTLHSDQQNYKTFNGTGREMDYFVAMNSHWCLIHVIAKNSNQNKEPNIISCCHRSQMGHYYLIKSAAPEVLIFQFTNLTHRAKYLFMEGGRIKLTSVLRYYGPFADISASYLQDEVVNLFIVSICVKKHQKGKKSKKKHDITRLLERMRVFK